MLADPKRIPRARSGRSCFHYFLDIELRFSMILVLLVGPGLISQDLRFNALPLYFSRPLRRIDYFLGKLGVVAWFLGMVVIVPSLIAYVLGLLFSLDITIIRDTFPLLLACLAYGVVIVVSAGTLMLALSSLSRNSRYVALFWLAIWFVTRIVGSILNQVNMEQRRHDVYRRQAKAFPVQRQGEKPLTQRGAVRAATSHGRWNQKSAPTSGSRRIRQPKTDWRPLVSYTANLSRVGQQLLETRRGLGRVEPIRARRGARRFFAEEPGPAISLVLVGRRAGRSFWTFRMHPELPRPVAGPAEVRPVVEFHEVSKWYGNVIGINSLSLRVPAGVTGLLGPNGAGKSTLLQLATGQLYPSQGRCACLGRRAGTTPP